MISVLPSYEQLDASLPERLGFDPLHATAVVAPTIDQMAEAHRLMGDGRVAEQPMFLASVPSVLDPTMQVGDDHVFSLETLCTSPYRLRRVGGQRRAERWQHAGAGCSPASGTGCGATGTMTPERYEQEFFMPKGYATSFAGGPGPPSGQGPRAHPLRDPRGWLYLTGAATFLQLASGRQRAERGARSSPVGRPRSSPRVGPHARDR